MRQKIVVFANQKGGVGKTTTASNLGAYLADHGNQVLLVDFDPQGNLTSSVGANADKGGVYEALSGHASIEQLIQDTPINSLKILSSNINLSGINVELANAEDKEFYLKHLLDPQRPVWDYILIDCPPSLGILTVNGLVAADSIIIPLQCEYFALEGLSLLLKTIQIVQKSLNPSLKIGGILFTMYDSRTRLAHEIVQEVTGYFGDKVLKTIIPRNVRLSEAPSYGKPIQLYDGECLGAKSYQQLALEVMDRV